MSPYGHTNASRQALSANKIVIAQAKEDPVAKQNNRQTFLEPYNRIESGNNEKNLMFATGTFRKMSREEYLMTHMGFMETAPLPGPQSLKVSRLSKQTLEHSSSAPLILPATPEDGRRLARALEGSVASASTCSRSAASRTQVSRASRASGEGSLASHRGSVAEAARRLQASAPLDFSDILDRWGGPKPRPPPEKFGQGTQPLYSPDLAMRVSGPTACQMY
mmetsp:Transcript_56224/g.147851  ORF Transcript_56224/g.147851 Transcript_56224/m.147851 type:complete len:221 (-) Transcript_56224:9-671(-)